jgi:hypothetical protein
MSNDRTSSMNTDENGGAPRNTQPSSAGADQVPNDATVASPAARGRSDALWGCLATTVAVAAMLWIAYQSNVRNEVAQVQKQISAQHDESVAELQSLKAKIQAIAAAQSQADVEIAKMVKQSPSGELQGLQNWVDTPRRGAKSAKR